MPNSATIQDAVASLQRAADTRLGNLDVIPSHIDLAGAEVELVGSEGREIRLKRLIDQVKGRYDHCFIDCPPSLSLLTVNALVAADAVMIPLQWRST